MPVYQMTGKDGKVYQITGPAGLDREAVKTAILARAPQAGKGPEEENLLEKIPVIGGLLAASADLPLNVVSGLAGTAKTVTDVFGANNVASDVLNDISTYAEGLTSAQSREDEKTAAAIRKAAEGKGIWEEVKAAARSFGVNPLDTAASVVGSALPFAAAGYFGGPGAMAALGAVSGAGTVKGSISDAVYARAREAGIPEEQAKAMADEAQSYGGENLDMIALGGALGALASGTGFDKQLGRAIAKRAFTDIAENAVEQQVARGFGRRVVTGIGAEAAPEAIQAGQERFAQNIAQQRAGYETDLMSGVVGQAAFEGLAGGVLGGVAGGLETTRPAAPEVETEAEAELPKITPVRAVQPAEIKAQFLEAAGPDISRRGDAALNALSLTVSQALSTRAPADIDAANTFIQNREDRIAAGEYDPDIAEPYIPALAQAKQMLADITPVAEVVPEGFVRVYHSGDVGEGKTGRWVSTNKQYASDYRPDLPLFYTDVPASDPRVNNPDYADQGVGQGFTFNFELTPEEAVTLKPIERGPEEVTSGPIGEPTAPVDAGVGTRVPTDRGPVPTGAAAPEIGGVEPRPVGVSEPAAPDVTVSADEESDTLAPAFEPKKSELKVIPGWLSRTRRKLADSFEGAKALDTWATNNFGFDTLPEALQTADKLETLRTKQAGQERNLQRKFFDPIVDLAGNLSVDLGDLGMYLWARGAADRNKAVAEVNPEEFPEGGSGLTTAQANEIMNTFKEEGKLAKLNQVARKADALVDFILDERVKAGRLSKEQAAELRAKQKYYMPLKGFAKDGDMLTSDMEETTDTQAAEALRALRNAAPGGTVQEFRQAFGRGSMPFHPLFNLFQDAEQAVRRNVENEAMRPILKLWKMNPSAFEGIMNVYSAKNPKYVSRGRDVPGGEPMSLGDMAKEYRSDKTGKYMLVKDNGVPHYIEFVNEGAGADLKRMYANMRPKDLEGAMKTLANINNFLKGMLTYKNPLYLMFVAPFRDTSAAIATAMYHQNLKGSPAFKKNLAAKTFLYAISPSTWAATKNYAFGKRPQVKEEDIPQAQRDLEEMIRQGGAPLQTRFLNVEEKASTAARTIRAMKGQEAVISKEAPRKLFDALNDWVDSLADMMDLNARFATYQAAKDVGILAPDAARLALDSSLNLTRRGEMARGLDLIFPFFGAGTEASRKTVRLLANPRSAVKIFGSMIALGVLESYINSMMSGDEDDDGQEDYLDQDLGAGLRMSRMVFYYGSGPDDYIKVPIDPMLGYFKFVGNKIGDVMNGAVSPSEATTGLVPGFASLMLPTRIPGTDVQSLGLAITPLVGKPLVETVINRNFFGSPIYKERRFEEAPRSELGRETTGEFWKGLAKTLNYITGGSAAVSGGMDFQPEVYRHFIEGYFGGPYQLAKQMAGMKEAEGMADVPGIKSFVGTGSEYAPQTKYFENTAVISQIMNRLKKLTPEQRAEQGERYFADTDPRIVEAYRMVDKQLDKVGKQQREAVGMARSEAEKKAILDYYRKEKNELYSAFNYVYNNVKKGQ